VKPNNKKITRSLLSARPKLFSKLLKQYQHCSNAN